MCLFHHRWGFRVDTLPFPGCPAPDIHGLLDPRISTSTCPIGATRFCSFTVSPKGLRDPRPAQDPVTAVVHTRLRFTTETADPAVPSAHEPVSRCPCQLLRDRARRAQFRGHDERHPRGRWRGRALLQLHPLHTRGGSGVRIHHGAGDTDPVPVHRSDQPQLFDGVLVSTRIFGSAHMRLQRCAEQRAGPCPIQARDDLHHHGQGLRLGVHDSGLNLHNARPGRDHVVAVWRRQSAVLQESTVIRQAIFRAKTEGAVGVRMHAQQAIRDSRPGRHSQDLRHHGCHTRKLIDQGQPPASSTGSDHVWSYLTR